MPDRHPSTLVYAAGASLAAIAFVYVFAPSWILDGEHNENTTKRSGVVGLTNLANDCYINSTLQALAGLSDLRLFLIREIHRRDLEDAIDYARPVEHPVGHSWPDWKLQSLQHGEVTRGLKALIDALNERPLTSRKTITASGFIAVLEHAFRQRISRQQQDAHEFLQLVVERLCEEYHAGIRVRKSPLSDVPNANLAYNNEESYGETATGNRPEPAALAQEVQEKSISTPNKHDVHAPSAVVVNSEAKAEEALPLEGATESTIECLTCGWQKSVTSAFCTLTLNVPQKDTTLNACFDGIFKTEHVEDYRCDKCRLLHAQSVLRQRLAKTTLVADTKSSAMSDIDKLQAAIDSDPEKPPEDVELPDIRQAPLSRIAKHASMKSFPMIIAVHLSRSIFGTGLAASKNGAKVAFPEVLSLGGLMSQHSYRLSSVVCHRGSHFSGHYDTFRRQAATAPFSASDAFRKGSIYDREVSISNPRLGIQSPGNDAKAENLSATRSSMGGFDCSPSSPAVPSGRDEGVDISAAMDDVISLRSRAQSARNSISSKMSSLRRSSSRTLAEGKGSSTAGELSPSQGVGDSVKCDPRCTDKQDSSTTKKRKSRKERARKDRWWRISDDKVSETTLDAVLGFQREVYLLFYEVQDRGGRG